MEETIDNNLRHNEIQSDGLTDGLEHVSEIFIQDGDILNEEQRNSINNLINDISGTEENYSDADFREALNIAQELSSSKPSYQKEGQQEYKEYISFLLNAHKDAVAYLNVFDRNETISFILTMLEDYIYPTKEVKAFAEFARNGGSFHDFIEAVKPIDFSALSDEEVIFNYYNNRMDSEALSDYLETLKDTGKMKRKADEIRKEVGVVQLSPDELVAKQKEMLAQQEVLKEKLRNGIENAVKNLNLKFRNREEKTEFINSLVETNHFYDDSDRLVYIGNTFSYILNSDINALVIAAYSLFNYSDEAERKKANINIIENVKKNLVQSRSMGINY